MAAIEFVGGPWDGEFKEIHEGDEVRLVLGYPPAKVEKMLTHRLSEEEPRIGVYAFVRRRDVHPGLMVWQGER